MTGIFQIFGWHKGRKNGTKNNKTNNNNDNEEPGPKVNAAAPTYYMFHDPAQRVAYDPAEHPHKQAQISRNSVDLQRASIDNSEVVSSDSLSILGELQRVAEQKLQVSRLSLDSKPRPYVFPDARDESPHGSSKSANEQGQQAYDTAASLFETSTFSRDSVNAKYSSKEGWNLPPRDMRGVSTATKRKEKSRVPLDNSRDFLPSSVDINHFDPKAAVSLQNVADIRDHAKLAPQQWRKGTQSSVEEDPHHSSVTRDLHQPSPFGETGQFFAESSRAVPLSQGYKESIRANEIKDSPSHHSSEKSWRDSSRRSVEVSQGNPADIRELAKLAQEWRRVSKAIVQQDPHHVGIMGDPPHRSPIVKETGKYSSEGRHAHSQLQDFEEAMRTIDFMESQRTSEKPSRDVSRNSVEWSPRSTTDIRDLARLAQQWRKGPQLAAEDFYNCITSRHSHRSSSDKEPGQYSTESNHATRQSQDFKGSMRDIDFRDRQNWRDTSRNSVEGRDQAHLASFTSHLSVDSRKYQSSTPLPLFDGRDEPRASSFQSPRASMGNSSPQAISRVKSSSMMSNSSVESRRRGQSVVARLMGLEMLPPDSDLVSRSENASSRMGKSLHNLVNSTPLVEPESPASDQDRLHSHLSQVAQQLKEISAKSRQVSLPKAKVKVNSRPRSRSRSSSPAPGQHEGDLYNIEHRQLQQKASDLRQQEEKGGQKPYPKQPMSPKHLQVEAMPFVLKKSKKGHHHNEGLLYGDMDQQLHQLCLKNAIQERKTLRQILEAMYLKGLLHQSHNKDILNAKSARMQRTLQDAQSPSREAKQMSSSMASNLARLERLDLEYQDILEFQNMRKEDNKLQKEASLEVNHSGEASIVVMKPLGHQTTTPIPIALSPLHQTRDVENMPSWGGSRKSTVTLTPHAGSYREKSSESSESSSNEGWSATGWPLNRSRPLGPNPSLRTNPQVPSDHYNSEERVGGLRNSRRARRKARASSKFATLDVGFGLNASLSVPPLHGQEHTSLSSRGPVFPDSRAYGKSGSGVFERERLHEENERPASEDKTKSRAPARSPSHDYGLIRRGGDDKDTKSILGDSRLEGNPDSSYPQRALIRLPSANQESSGKIPLEVDLLRHRRKSGKSSHSRRKTRSSHSPDIPAVVSPTKADNCHFHSNTLNSDHMLIDDQGSHLIVDQATPLETSAASPLSLTPRSIGAKPTKVMEKEDQESQFLVTPEMSKAINQGGEGANALIIHISSSGCSIDGSQDAKVEIQELSEELSLLKQEYIEEVGHLDDGTNHASPVSVLETVSFQEEESSLSPKSVQSSAFTHDEGNLHSTETDRSYNAVEAICSPVAEKLTLFGTEALEKICISQSEVVWSMDLEDQEDYLSRCDIKLQLPVLVEREERVMNAGSYLENQSEERAYVNDLLVMSGLTEEVSSGINAKANKKCIDDIYTQTEDHFQLKESVRLENGEQGRKQERMYKQGVDQHLLFDCVNEILRRRIEPFLSPQPWGKPYLGRKPAGQQLVQEVWDELQDLHCPLVDAYDALYAILQKDYTRKEFQWLDFSVEIGEVGFQLADMILEEIVEAAVQDVTEMCTSLQKHSPPAGGHGNGETTMWTVLKQSPPPGENDNAEMAMCTMQKYLPLLPRQDDTLEMAMCTVKKHSLLPSREDENTEMVMCTPQKHLPLPPREDDNAEKRRKELVEKTKRDLLAWRVQYQEV
ncbi:hypothetical protein BDL97_08G148000 [Sphagnum fallax]|nr:hypothetical protein BDL97_08G148000 [Sphagnum fallax]